MNRLTGDQVKLAQVVLDRIIEFPKAHSQIMWYHMPVEADGPGDRRTSAPLFSVSSLVGHSAEREMWRVPRDAMLALNPAAMVECGSTACVAGHAVLAAAELGMIDLHEESNNCIMDLAADLLGLDTDNDGDVPLFSAVGSELDVQKGLEYAIAQGHWRHCDSGTTECEGQT